MTSKHVCRTCLQTLRSKRPQLQSQSPFRAFSSYTSLLQQSTLAPANPPQASSETRSSESPLPSDTERIALSRNLRRSLTGRKRGVLSQSFETYEAYSLTDRWILSIQKRLDYDIPQIKSKEEIPKLEGGEEIGVPLGDGAWYKELALPVTFNTWAQLLMLHLYVLQTRLRTLPAASAKTFSQHLTDHFFDTAELKMDFLHSIGSRSIRSKYLKDLFLQWRGVLISYDEGLVKGDAVLAAAVWRNVFQGNEDVDPVRLAMVVSWLRREVGRVGEEPDVGGWDDFGGVKGEEAGVLMKSHLMDKA